MSYGGGYGSSRDGGYSNGSVQNFLFLLHQGTRNLAIILVPVILQARVYGAATPRSQIHR